MNSCWQCSASMKSLEKRKLSHALGQILIFFFPPLLFPQFVFSLTMSSPPTRATSAVIESTPNVMSV